LPKAKYLHLELDAEADKGREMGVIVDAEGLVKATSSSSEPSMSISFLLINAKGLVVVTGSSSELPMSFSFPFLNDGFKAAAP